MKEEIISQYKASLSMLSDIITECPENLWDSKEYENAYWRIVYHTLFYTSLYLSKSPSEFIPWAKHKKDYNNLGEVTRDKRLIIIDIVYSKSEMLGYMESILNETDKSVNSMLEDEQSGFEWLAMSKIELHLYNIRHIQHHVGQLIERLHSVGIKGIRWKAME